MKLLPLMSFKSPFRHLFFGNTMVLERALVTFIAKLSGEVFKNFLVLSPVNPTYPPFHLCIFVQIDGSVKSTALAEVHCATKPITLTTLRKLLATPNLVGKMTALLPLYVNFPRKALFMIFKIESDFSILFEALG